MREIDFHSFSLPCHIAKGCHCSWHPLQYHGASGATQAFCQDLASREVFFSNLVRLEIFCSEEHNGTWQGSFGGCQVLFTLCNVAPPSCAFLLDPIDPILFQSDFLAGSRRMFLVMPNALEVSGVPGYLDEGVWWMAVKFLENVGYKWGCPPAQDSSHHQDYFDL